MTRTISALYDAVSALKKANKNLCMVTIGHLNDGQKEVLSDCMGRIAESTKELSEIEYELRFGTTWTEPITDREKIQDVIDWARKR